MSRSLLLAAVLAIACAAQLARAEPEDARQLLGRGAWSWFGDPRAVTHGGKAFAGWIDSRGQVRIAALDIASGRVTRSPSLHSFWGDDHNNPSLLVRPDGRIAAFFSPHSGRTLPPAGIRAGMYYRVTRRPGDVRSWRPLRRLKTNTPGSLGYTYPNPVPLGGGRTALLWRGGNWMPSMSVWRRRGGWSRARTVVRVPAGGRPYVKVARGPHGAVDLAFTEDNPGSRATSLFYARLGQDGRFRRARGAAAGRMPLSLDRADRVYDGRGRGGRAWVLDVAVDRRTRRPTILFATLPGDRRVAYRYATWTGRAWRVRRIGAIDHTILGNYPGGGSLDHRDPSVVLLSRRVRGRFEIERWATPDGGRTWRSAALTRNSRVDNIRPVVARGRSDVIVWLRGRYRGWTSYATRVVVSRGRAVAKRAVALPGR